MLSRRWARWGNISGPWLQMRWLLSPVADVQDVLMREPFNPHCGEQGSYPTGYDPDFAGCGPTQSTAYNS